LPPRKGGKNVQKKLVKGKFRSWHRIEEGKKSCRLKKGIKSLQKKILGSRPNEHKKRCRSPCSVAGKGEVSFSGGFSEGGPDQKGKAGE